MSMYGVNSMVAPLTRVAVRPPSLRGDYAVAHWAQPLDGALLPEQHGAFVALLERLGCGVEVLPPTDDMPDAWLARDRGPLRLSRLDTPARYRALRVTTLTRRLPELGSAFGGDSKSSLPGIDRVSIEAYLREVRRAEWVHWASCLTVVPLWFFNPWWLALAFTVVVLGANGLFILVLRHNRVRLLRILTRG